MFKDYANVLSLPLFEWKCSHFISITIDQKCRPIKNNTVHKRNLMLWTFIFFVYNQNSAITYLPMNVLMTTYVYLFYFLHSFIRLLFPRNIVRIENNWCANQESINADLDTGYNMKGNVLYWHTQKPLYIYHKWGPHKVLRESWCNLRIGTLIVTMIREFQISLCISILIKVQLQIDELKITLKVSLESSHLTLI